MARKTVYTFSENIFLKHREPQAKVWYDVHKASNPIVTMRHVSYVVFKCESCKMLKAVSQFTSSYH